MATFGILGMLYYNLLVLQSESTVTFFSVRRNLKIVLLAI